MQNKNVLRFLSATIAMFLNVSAYGESNIKLPPEILRHTPKGFDYVTSVSEILPKDQGRYIVVAYEKEDEDKRYTKNGEGSIRPVLIFLQQGNEPFQLIGRNDHVVFQIDEGGQCDPFMDGEDGLAAKGSFFTVQNSVACGNHWSDYITFRFDAVSRRFWFQNERVHSYDYQIRGDDASKDIDTVKRANPNKPISFDNWKLNSN